MDIIEVINSRKSIRKFKPDPVPREVLQDIFATAIRVPSAINTQTWEITVITGRPLEEIKRENVDLLMAGVPGRPEIPEIGFSGIYAQRAKALGKELFQLMGIARDDRTKRTEWVQRGFRYFDAPAAIILSFDRSIEEPLALHDAGALAQTICLTAFNYGLGTCIERQGVNFPQVLRKHAGIPETKLIVISIAIGYPDWDFPANKLRSKREPVDDVVTWRGFDE